MSDHKVVKSVAFNKRNPDEKLILDSIKRRNFSKYVKKLLLADIKKKELERNHEQQYEAPQEYQSYQEPYPNQYPTDTSQHPQQYYTQPQHYPNYQQPQQPLSSSEQLSRYRQEKDWR